MYEKHDEFSDKLEPIQIDLLELLPISSRSKFSELKKRLNQIQRQEEKSKRVNTFIKCLQVIKSFCKCDQNEEYIREIICGICWIDNDIYLNTLRFRHLLNRSKSSINSYFAQLNYEPIALNQENSTKIFNIMPFLKENYVEKRQWVIRRKTVTNIEIDPFFLEEKQVSDLVISGINKNFGSEADLESIFHEHNIYDFINELE